MKTLLEQLEPGAQNALNPLDTCIKGSIALSLKRIADALTGVGQSAFTMPLNQYGENIGECIEGQFNRSGR